MSASDHKQLDAQTDAHAHTHACRRVCLVQCWKAASTALSLKAVYCDMLLILALCPIFFTPLFFHWPICAFSAERLSHWQLWCCLSLSLNYLLHQRRVSSSQTQS